MEALGTIGCGCDHETCGGDNCLCRHRLPAVLVVDDDPDWLEQMRQLLEDTGKVRVFTADSVHSAARVLKEKAVRLAMVDHHMPESGRTGTALLELLFRDYPGVSRFLMSGRGTASVLAGAINRASPHHYIRKGVPASEILRAVLEEIQSAV